MVMKRNKLMTQFVLISIALGLTDASRHQKKFSAVLE